MMLLIIYDKLFDNSFSFHRVGIDLPEIEVRYEHLTIEADAYVGSRALPTFINFISNFFEVKRKS